MKTSSEQTLLPRCYRVRHRRPEIRDTVSLELEPTDRGEIPAFACGQFNMLSPFGMGEIPISISGNPYKGGLFVHTIRAVGAVSRELCRLQPGEVLGLRGPFGSHWPLERAEGKDLVIACGGLGLPPLRSVMHQIEAQRSHYGRIALLYGARTPADILYRRELARWRQHFDLDIFVTVDAATGDWRGSVGVVTRLVPRLACDPVKTLAFLCGPEVMMRFMVLELEKYGLAPEQIFVSMERNMKCALGWCGHCQYGPHFLCKDGPIFPYSRVQRLFTIREI